MLFDEKKISSIKRKKPFLHAKQKVRNFSYVMKNCFKLVRKISYVMKRIIFFCLFSSTLSAFSQSTPTTIITSFDHIIDSLYKPSEPGGVALVARHNQVLYNHAFGMANMELRVKMQPDMIFEIGSMTKQFTAVCILQLMEQGKLKLDDPINKYLTDCPAAWQPITIEHLLTHTSGIVDEAGPQAALTDIVKLYRDKSLASIPGTKKVYSNISYNLLGFIIEKISGMPYPDYLQKKILSPLGMNDTYYGSNERIIPGRVPGYIKAKRGNGFLNSYMFITPSAAGALISNTTDLLKWNQALISGKLIKPETLNKAWSSYQLADGKSSYYGYGWETDGTIQGSSIIEHGGVAVGYLTDAIYLPKEDIYVAVLTNQRGVLPEIVAANLAAITIGKPYHLKEIALNDDSLKAYTGVYKQADDTVARYITLNNHHLYYQRAGGPKILIRPFGSDQFYFDNFSVQGKVTRDAGKRIAALELFNMRHMNEPINVLKRTNLPLPGN
jgi:CubicO group peptidase (beta-lactamase class C family)